MDEEKTSVDDKKIEEMKKKVITKGVVLLLTFSFVVLIIAVAMYIYNSANATVKKPVIYFYPEEECEISVKLKNEELLTSTYPKYQNEWNIRAFPDGMITDLDTGKDYYSLYYESKLKNEAKIEKDGFIIKGKDIESFLDEKLDYLGLNYKEKEEFILYWLPILQKNKYNYIRFLTEEEIEENMPIEFSTKPDTVIRVWMTYKKINRPISVVEQKLEKKERTGFTVVEWGVTEIR